MEQTIPSRGMLETEIDALIKQEREACAKLILSEVATLESSDLASLTPSARKAVTTAATFGRNLAKAIQERQ